MTRTPPDRRVVTFYSYKGGVGRTMALANVAYRLANTHGLDVIVVDWDLEAPGLHRFFGISQETAAKTNGILDYFLAWRGAVRRNDPEPPPEASAVMSWILPVDSPEHKPKFGSVSVLLAGRQDAGYTGRLASFDWEGFYANEAGASAVEGLREKLTERANVVLIDSRTGRTDAAGICTIQLPDGVVLMTAPNEQSFDGVEMVARAIAGAKIDERVERAGRARLWLAMARVASVEESYLAAEWFKQHAGRFEEGVAEGLWLKEDHPEGMRSLEVPQVGRWAFGERVLRPMSEAGPGDPLALAYARLTETVLRWLNGEPSIDRILPRATWIKVADAAPVQVPAEQLAIDLQSIELAAAEAEERGDALGLGLVLLGLASPLYDAGRRAEAIRKLEQAIGIFMSRGARRPYALALGLQGALLSKEKRWIESNELLARSIELDRTLGNRALEAAGLEILATNKVAQNADAEAIELFERASVIEKTLDPPLPRQPRAVMSFALWRMGRHEEATRLLREELKHVHEAGDTETERLSIEALLELTKDAPLPEADALRTRLDELKAQSPTAP